MGARTTQLESLMETFHDETSAHAAAKFLLSQMLIKPDGAFYAKWDPERNEAIWYYSSNHTAIFEWPEQTEPILRQTSRGTFRSVIFRVGAFAAEEHDYVPLCGFYFLENVTNGKLAKKRVMVHADFFPEFGVWIKATFLTVNDDRDAADGKKPVFKELI
jgi:hypothetical protein